MINIYGLHIFVLFDTFLSLAKEYPIKNFMIHLLTFTLVLQIHPRLQLEDRLRSTLSTEKILVDRFTTYLADSDKLFVLSVIDALLHLNGFLLSYIPDLM